VGDGQVVTGIGEVGVRGQVRCGRGHRSGSEAPEAEALVRHAGLIQGVPQVGVERVPAGCGRVGATLVLVGVVAAAVVAVVGLAGLLRVSVGRRRGGPVPAVGRDLGGGVEVVQGDEVAGQGADVGGAGVVEQVQRGVSVAGAQVAEHLVVGAVFLDDVDDVL